MMLPFDYPEQPHEWRHGPLGYATVESYRSWLRDEFSFRCVYCLDREQWHNHVGKFAIDHFLPVAAHPEKATNYTNLVYACVTCNLTKAQGKIPDPTRFLLGDAITIHDDGRIETRTKEATRLVDKLLLNSNENQAFRRRWASIIRLAQTHSHDLYRELLGYPSDLPDLSRLRPPGGNTHPEGIEQSHHARRMRRELPETY